MKTNSNLLSVFLLFVPYIAVSCSGNKQQGKAEITGTDSLPVQEVKAKIADTITTDSLKTINVNPEHEPLDFVIEPICRSRYEGEEISPELLSIKTEYDYYPLSSKSVNLIICNRSEKEYTCGDDYSLEYFDEKKGIWEPQPVNPISEDMLWIISPQYYSARFQNITLYTDYSPNRPGKYRITKPFNNDKEIASAEFEIIDRKDVEKKLMRKLRDYLNGKDNNDTISQNFISADTRGNDTLYVHLKNNSLKYREMFRSKVLNYSALALHGETVNPPLKTRTVSDTMNISMKTEKTVYPVSSEYIPVIITNNNDREIFFGLDYEIARKEGDKWIPLNTKSVVNSVGIGIKKGGTHHFNASLFRLVNDIKPGLYKVYKPIGFDGSIEKWYMSAEFTIK